MQAFILAGGLGTRLRSIVDDRPKPLAPIGDRPFLEHQLVFLRTKQIHEFVFCVGYRHEQIQDFFGDGEKWGVSITYSVESQPLGTGGALKLAERYAKEAFLVLNGDTFLDLDISELLHAHRSHRAKEPSCLATLTLTEAEDASDGGSICLNDGNAIVSFREKEVKASNDHYVNAGVYVLEPRIFDWIPDSRHVSLERDVFPRVIDSPEKICGFRTDKSFIDIGTPEGYHRFLDHTGGILS